MLIRKHLWIFAALLFVGAVLYVLLDQHAWIGEPHGASDGSTAYSTTPAPSAEHDPAQIGGAPHNQAQLSKRKAWLKFIQGARENPTNSFSLWGPDSKATDDEIAAFLDKYGHTPNNYVAVADMNRDVRWAKIGLEKFPNAPQLIGALIGREALPQDQAAELCERWSRVDPENPVPRLYQLSNLPPEAVVRELKNITNLSGFYLHASEAFAAKEQFRKFLGRDCPEASCLSGYSDASYSHLQQFAAASKQLENIRSKPAESGGSEMELRELHYKLGAMLHTPEAGRTTIAQLIGIAVQKNALSGLDESDEVPFLSANAGKQLNLLEARRNEIAELAGTLNSNEVFTRPELLQELTRRSQSEGELEASRWVIKQLK